MASASLGSFNLLSGIRYERTEDEGTGVVTLPENSAILDYEARQRARYSPVTAEASYDNWFPNVQARYTLWKDLIFRASFTKSIGRQNFGNIIPGYSVVNPSGSNPGRVESSNINLDPILFTNYEASVEYYLKPVGMISAGVFAKDIADYTRNVDTRLVSADNPEYPTTSSPAVHRSSASSRQRRRGQSHAVTNSATASSSAPTPDYFRASACSPTTPACSRKATAPTAAQPQSATEKAPLEGFVPITTNAGISYAEAETSPEPQVQLQEPVLEQHRGRALVEQPRSIRRVCQLRFIQKTQLLR
ncbi:MAG: TonB-dependent receptor [Nibricoccus sp.]